METFNLDNLNKYSLTNDLFNNLIDKSFETFSSKANIPKSQAVKRDRFINIPKSQDQLFWCFFIFQ